MRQKNALKLLSRLGLTAQKGDFYWVAKYGDKQLRWELDGDEVAQDIHLVLPNRLSWGRGSFSSLVRRLLRVTLKFQGIEVLLRYNERFGPSLDIWDSEGGGPVQDDKLVDLMRGYGAGEIDQGVIQDWLMETRPELFGMSEEEARKRWDNPPHKIRDGKDRNVKQFLQDVSRIRGAAVWVVPPGKLHQEGDWVPIDEFLKTLPASVAKQPAYSTCWRGSRPCLSLNDLAIKCGD